MFLGFLIFNFSAFLYSFLEPTIIICIFGIISIMSITSFSQLFGFHFFKGFLPPKLIVIYFLFDNIFLNFIIFWNEISFIYILF